ncbi:hypothetical protein [Polyangium jinanense]|uniref:Uncharacterized protein n=1 Tax=Polyangium jinanense TaxID=2829994 RepID=A0A9X3WYE3_9BACT|nr:hypothetical protein [Polyangium jinanense]MDC3952989.1 hypothetical protein [Polyangium jinanense]MDC3980607.1 hypothetical protein [Polyangium jinanense]
MKDEKNQFLLRACAASAALCTTACSVGDVSDLFAFRTTAVDDALTIRMPDGRVFRGDPASIEVRAPLPNGPPSTASVTLSTADRRGYGLSVAFDISTDTLLDQSFSVALTDGYGGGTLAHLSQSGARIIGPGTLSLRTSTGKITGQFETEDETFPAGTIEGRYEVVCLVLPEMLGMSPNGEASQGTWILVEDEAKTSKFCQTFAGL